jgi:hypothetical protein
MKLVLITELQHFRNLASEKAQSKEVVAQVLKNKQNKKEGQVNGWNEKKNKQIYKEGNKENVTEKKIK